MQERLHCWWMDFCSIKTLTIFIFFIICNPRTSHIKPSVIPFKHPKPTPMWSCSTNPIMQFFGGTKNPTFKLNHVLRIQQLATTLKPSKTLELQHCKNIIHLKMDDKVGRKVVKVELIVIVGTMMYTISFKNLCINHFFDIITLFYNVYSTRTHWCVCQIVHNYIIHHDFVWD